MGPHDAVETQMVVPDLPWGEACLGRNTSLTWKVWAIGLK